MRFTRTRARDCATVHVCGRIAALVAIVARTAHTLDDSEARNLIMVAFPGIDPDVLVLTADVHDMESV